jgi:radical SAM superfamily enzyme YgiQ (UPF0313 family)
MRRANPALKVAFVGPHVQVQPDAALKASEDIDYIVRGEFDHSVVEFARGHALPTIADASYRHNGTIVHNPERTPLHTFNIRKDRILELCERFKPLGFRWSCTARVHSDYDTLKAMADAGARLFIVGFESGDDQILKNIKKGATVEMGRAFAKNCRKLGIRVHGDFIIGLPGETKESIQKTIDFAKELDSETIQVSIAHAYSGTELHQQLERNHIPVNLLMADSHGHQLPHIEYPKLSRQEMMFAVNRFYDEYYFRPSVVWRIVREALWSRDERRRLTQEAIDFLKVRAGRRRYAQARAGDSEERARCSPRRSSRSRCCSMHSATCC